MLTFKQFQEEWKRGIDDKSYTKKWGITHTDNVAGHEVKVSVTHLHRSMKNPQKKGHVAVNFSVDGSQDKENMDPKSGTKILHHVHKVIKHYIEKRKPKVVRIQGNTEQKQDVYSQYVKHIANRLGGTVSKDDSPSGDVHVIRMKK